MDRQILKIMLLHAAVELLLLLGTNRITGKATQWARAILAILLGSVYSGACLLPGFRFLGNGFWRFVSLAMMAWIGIGRLQDGAIFVLLSLAFSGIALANGPFGVWSSVFGLLTVGLGCAAAFREPVQRGYVPVVLRHQGHHVSLTALRDTGNTLRDPVTGQQVLVVDAGVGTALTGLSRDQLRLPLQTISLLPGARLIPYRAVGQSAGFLLGLPINDVTMGNWKGSCVVAFAPDGLEHCGFQGLIGGSV